ncbi:MAG: trigger factor [Lachnospiraceae bacterium]
MVKRKLLVMLALGATVALCGCTGANNTANSTTKTEEGTTKAEGESSSAEKGEETASEATTEAPDFEKEYNYADYIELGNYKGIEYEEQDTKVTDEEVEENIKSTLEASSEIKEDKTKKKVEDGSIANIDYTGKVDGKEFDGGSAEGYDLEIGSDTFIDGFEDQLIGMKVGEEKTIKVTFPKDYQSEDLAGKEAEFDVKVNYIGKEVVPELTDEYAKENLEAKSVEDYKQTVRKNLEESKQETAKATIQGTIWSKVVSNAKEKKELPEDMIRYQKEQLESQYSSYAEMYGMEVDDFMQYMTGMTLDECAKDSVKRAMVANLIIAKEKMSLSDKEYKERLENLASEYQYESAEEFEKANGKEVIKEYLLNEKLLEYLVGQGKQTKATTAASTKTTETSKETTDKSTEKK